MCLFRLPASYEMPYAPRAVHPYYPAGNHSTRSSRSQAATSRKASSSRSPTEGSRRSQSLIPATAVSEGRYPHRRSMGFGSMQSVLQTTSHESSAKKTPRTPRSSTIPSRQHLSISVCKAICFRIAVSVGNVPDADGTACDANGFPNDGAEATVVQTGDTIL